MTWLPTVSITLPFAAMLLLILAGIVYVIITESLAVAVLTAALVLYRAQRPSPWGRRIRDAWYARQVAQVGEVDE